MSKDITKSEEFRTLIKSSVAMGNEGDEFSAERYGSLAIEMLIESSGEGDREKAYEYVNSEIMKESERND